LFAKEALTWVKLEKHPFIVRAYMVEKFDGQPYVITEYVLGQENMGGDLRSWLGHFKLTLPIAVEMALQIAQGMQHAVRKIPGLLHRDLKPANILVDSQARAMVTDFGLTSAEGSGAGTPAYMAPEQWREEQLDCRADIYAYGCVLYEIFTGHRMFTARSEHEWETAHLSQVPVPPIEINSSLPARISDFIVRCLAKNRTQRPADWDEVVLECARWFHESTGLPVVFEFSANSLSAFEYLSAGYSFFNLEKLEEALAAFEEARSAYKRDLDHDGMSIVSVLKGLALAEFMSFPRFFVCQRTWFMLPVFPDVAC
jgi:serine/threonine protein kinase